MKIFIASPWRNKTAVELLTQELAKRGYETYSFLQSGSNLPTGISIAEELHMFGEALRNWQDDPNIKKIFDSELGGLKASDLVVLLEPVGRSSLLEAGIAFGLGKKVVSVGSIEKPEVFYLMCQGLYPDVNAFLAALPGLG